MGPTTPPALARLYRGERLGLIFVTLLMVGFGALVVHRSAFQMNRKTDFGVYARTAWAVISGEDIYRISDDNGWHYCYPPPFAVLMVPLADPPAGVERTGYLPFWAGVAIWFTFSVLCLAYALHRFAGVALPDTPRGSRRWWYARTVPLYVGLGGIGFTLSRGQVNLQVVALFAGLFAAAMANRRIAAGLFWGAAVCLKVIPAFLGLYFLWQRDVRAFVGVTAALVIGLFVIPAAVWGPQGAIDQNLAMVQGVLAPGAGGSGDQTRAEELTNDTATDSQSFRSAIHAWRHPNPAERPAKADRWSNLAHWGLGAFLTGITMLVWWRHPPVTAADHLIVLGALATLMTLVTPVSHMHYYAYVLPLVCGIWLKGLALRPEAVTAGWQTTTVLYAWGFGIGIPLFPGYWPMLLRDFGFGPAMTVGLWAYSLHMLTRMAPAASATLPFPTRSEQAQAA